MRDTSFYVLRNEEGTNTTRLEGANVADLSTSTDDFGGLFVALDSLPRPPSDFGKELSKITKDAQKQGLSLVWVTIPQDQSVLIPAATAEGFLFHRCEQTEVTMFKRLSEQAFVFPTPSHFVGAGAVVQTEDGRILVVREKHKSRSGIWKLPGGLLDPSEHIQTGIVREILEETGIKTEFGQLLSFGHLHNWMYGKSNIYLVCRLKPLSLETTPDGTEVKEARWMDLSQFLRDEQADPFSAQVVAATASTSGWQTTSIDGFSPNLLEVFLPDSAETFDR